MRILLLAALSISCLSRGPHAGTSDAADATTPPLLLRAGNSNNGSGSSAAAGAAAGPVKNTSALFTGNENETENETQDKPSIPAPASVSTSHNDVANHISDNDNRPTIFTNNMEKKKKKQQKRKKNKRKKRSKNGKSTTDNNAIQVPTASPTNAPSDQTTKDPSVSPTQQPTSNPTERPTDEPTIDPTPSPTLAPSTNPTYEPTRNPTPPPTPSPTTLAPSKQPTAKPTNVPKPSKSPTEAPTLKPTCDVNGNFNLCIAIDMSGSVCNGNSNSLCTACQPSQCNSGGQNLSRCCSNFDNVIEFTRSLVTMLGNLPTDQDFSVVHFGTEVEIASTLESAKQSVETLNKLIYSGGKTNMVGAINSCQNTLLASPPDRKNLMLLITDGAPSVPDFNAATVTASAATNVKSQGTFIIPILIEDPANQFIPEVAFLRNQISSDGKVFVADFGGLSDIRDAVFEQVTCES